MELSVSALHYAANRVYYLDDDDSRLLSCPRTYDVPKAFRPLYRAFLYQNRFAACPAANTTADGSQIHTSSLLITRKPQAEKKGRMPIGGTAIGRQGKK